MEEDKDKVYNERFFQVFEHEQEEMEEEARSLSKGSEICRKKFDSLMQALCKVREMIVLEDDVDTGTLDDIDDAIGACIDHKKALTELWETINASSVGIKSRRILYEKIKEERKAPLIALIDTYANDKEIFGKRGNE